MDEYIDRSLAENTDGSLDENLGEHENKIENNKIENNKSRIINLRIINQKQ